MVGYITADPLYLSAGTHMITWVHANVAILPGLQLCPTNRHVHPTLYSAFNGPETLQNVRSHREILTLVSSWWRCLVN